jgi:hypothetical protein
MTDLDRLLLAERAIRAEAANERVRRLHVPETPPEGNVWISGGTAPHCAGCSTGDPYLDPEWPCDTIRALDGDLPDSDYPDART